MKEAGSRMRKHPLTAGGALERKRYGTETDALQNVALPPRLLLWSYVVEMICLDTNKPRWVSLDLPLDILVFFEGTQMPTCSRV